MKWCNQSQVELILKIHIDYLSQRTGVIGIYRVGDNKTVNTSTTPHISDQLWTENECETLLCWFIVMIWALFSDNMYRYGRHFRSFYRNRTILETVSPGGFDCLGQHGESFFYWNTTTRNNSSTDVSLFVKCENQMWRIFLYPTLACRS